ncbi:MAG TPA: hypothetical protein VME47_10615 [Acetobacteraceae bacterium]|nr:hypothetical protein [Acetobacteraceae bacterium]
MTPVAAEGLKLPAGLRELVGEDAAELAGLICGLYRDDQAYRHAVRDGRRLIRENHAEAVVMAALQIVIDGRKLPTQRMTRGAPAVSAA